MTVEDRGCRHTPHVPIAGAGGGSEEGGGGRGGVGQVGQAVPETDQTTLDIPAAELRRLEQVNYLTIAKRTGYTRPHVSRVFRGESGPSEECLVKLAGAVGVQVASMRKYVEARSATRRRYRARPRQEGEPLPPLRNPNGGVNPVAARYMREILGIGQRHVAGLLGVTKSAVSSWETGKSRPRPEIEDRYVRILARALEVQSRNGTRETTKDKRGGHKTRDTDRGQTA